MSAVFIVSRRLWSITLLKRNAIQYKILYFLTVEVNFVDEIDPFKFQTETWEHFETWILKNTLLFPTLQDIGRKAL